MFKTAHVLILRCAVGVCSQLGAGANGERQSVMESLLQEEWHACGLWVRNHGSLVKTSVSVGIFTYEQLPMFWLVVSSRKKNITQPTNQPFQIWGKNV